MIRLAVTGSIGMGKSATTRLFAEAGFPVWDADAAVHELYAPGGAAVAPLAAAFPEAVVDGAVDRARLAERLKIDPPAFARLEAIVHPLVAQSRTTFLQQSQAAGADLVVMDIPLLFETGAEQAFDAVVVVSAPAHVQRERVLSRPGMDTARFEALLQRQMTDAEKRARADFVIDTALGPDAARLQVEDVLAKVRTPGFRSRPRGLDAASEPPQ